MYFRNGKVGKIGHPNLLQCNLFKQWPHAGIKLSAFPLFHTGDENVIPVVFALLTVPTTRKHMKPFSIKIIMFIIVKTMGRCITEGLFEQNVAIMTEESRRYDRLMEHVVYTGLQQC